MLDKLYLQLFGAKIMLGDKPVGDAVDVPTVESGNVLGGILNMVYVIAGFSAVLVIVIAGFYFVTANGNAQNIQRAKNAILYAVIGLVVIIMAFGITSFITSRTIGS